MADLQPTTEKPRSLAELATSGPTIAAAFLVRDGADWTLSTTGPNEGGFDTVGGDIEINDALTDHVRFFRRINGNYVLR